ncbi:potassium channel family protein [Tateyamaria sp. SN6-1]|uniref:potassium channel family protein n=1 Tax=Tateyamaria sp. SN6-1 TaxID=3092148 RepID=UPI0039F54472
MTLFAQVAWGTCLLTACALLHVVVVAGAVPYANVLGAALRARRVIIRNAAMLSFGVFVVVLGHTLQIWAWAFVLLWIGAFADFPESFYFATATYTTLGYGDLILGPELRVFASFASITGLLTFGISTGLLINMVSRLMPDDPDQT